MVVGVVGVVGVGVRLSSAAEGTMGRKEDLTWHKGAKDIPGRWIYLVYNQNFDTGFHRV